MKLIITSADAVLALHQFVRELGRPITIEYKGEYHVEVFDCMQLDRIAIACFLVAHGYDNHSEVEAGESLSVTGYLKRIL